jgi:hypothetical protein
MVIRVVVWVVLLVPCAASTAAGGVGLPRRMVGFLGKKGHAVVRAVVETERPVTLFEMRKHAFARTVGPTQSKFALVDGIPSVRETGAVGYRVTHVIAVDAAMSVPVRCGEVQWAARRARRWFEPRVEPVVFEFGASYWLVLDGTELGFPRIVDSERSMASPGFEAAGGAPTVVARTPESNAPMRGLFEVPPSFAPYRSAPGVAVVRGVFDDVEQPRDDTTELALRVGEVHSSNLVSGRDVIACGAWYAVGSIAEPLASKPTAGREYFVAMTRGTLGAVVAIVHCEEVAGQLDRHAERPPEWMAHFALDENQSLIRATVEWSRSTYVSTGPFQFTKSAELFVRVDHVEWCSSGPELLRRRVRPNRVATLHGIPGAGARVPAVGELHEGDACWFILWFPLDGGDISIRDWSRVAP